MIKEFSVLLLLGVVAARGSEERVKRQANYPRPSPTLRYSPQAFRVSEDIDHNTVTPAPYLQVTRQQNSAYRPEVNTRSRQEYQQQTKSNRPQNLKEEELEEEEKEEPDRLTMLLPQSKFSCQGRATGYYADEGLTCEVFHYCQDNARHSWICPEGFLFHQVHLICMPPGHDNICTQSSQFHFVNDYLYKPINAEEVERKPNVTLRYSERYYPETFYREDEALPSLPSPKPTQQVKISQPTRPLQQQQIRQPNQVFHSPEEVNIPLQHRRPTPSQQVFRNYPPHSSEEYEY